MDRLQQPRGTPHFADTVNGKTAMLEAIQLQLKSLNLCQSITMVPAIVPNLHVYIQHVTDLQFSLSNHIPVFQLGRLSVMASVVMTEVVWEGVMETVYSVYKLFTVTQKGSADLILKVLSFPWNAKERRFSLETLVTHFVMILWWMLKATCLHFCW